MARGRSERIHTVIETLNAIRVGELSGIETRLAKAREELRELGEDELVQTVDGARSSLLAGDVTTFRRLTAQTVARLGHLR